MPPLSGFIGPSYTLSSIKADCQRSLNLYPEINELGTGKNREVARMVSTPALVLFVACGVGPHRGSWRVDQTNRAFCVSGNQLFEVSAGAVATVRGVLGTVTGRCSLADNGTQLIVIDGTNGYLLDLATNAFAVIPDLDLPVASKAAFIDGYFLVNSVETQQFFVSSLYDGNSWNALDFGTVEAFPDNIKSLIADHEDVIFCGDDTTEIFFNVGNADFPFDRRSNGVLEDGICAPESLAKIDNSVFWIAKNANGQGIVVRLADRATQRVSNFAIEKALASYGTDIQLATAYTYSEQGHSFYVLNIPNAGTTWVYDAATGLWHERTYTKDGQQERHRGETHMFAFGKHLIGDYQNGNLFYFDDSVYTDNGATITRQRRMPHISKDGKRLFFQRLEIDMEVGVGPMPPLYEGDGVTPRAPQAMLRYSNDGGMTWGPEIWSGFGQLGEYSARCVYDRLGSGRDRVFEWTVTDPVKVAPNGANLDVFAGAH